jgi:RHS repeat-associated protein
VGLDAGGRVTSLADLSLGWSGNGQLRRVDSPVPLAPVHFGFDGSGRRAFTLGAPTLVGGGSEFYLYEGANRVGAVVPSVDYVPGVAQATFLYDGIDHPLRLAGAAAGSVPEPLPPAAPTSIKYSAGPYARAYYELDLAGNVRRLRAPGGADLGGYRYSAFGKTVENTVVSLPDQPLRWKGMWRFDLGGVELYDARARMWSPALGSFLSIDEFSFHDGRTTLWGWPGQNPLRYRDPSGHYSSGLVAFIVTNPETIPFAIAAVAAVMIAKDLWDFEHPEITQASGGPGPSSCPSAQPASSASPGAAPQASPAGPRDAGADADAGRPRGVIYLRRDRLGGMKDYVGQAESEARFAERQAEHGRDHPGADFEFFVLDTPEASGLDVAEESWIRAGGGPSRRSSDGGLSNKNFSMSGRRYEDAGGSTPWP